MKRRTFLKTSALVPTFIGLVTPPKRQADFTKFCSKRLEGHTYDLRKPQFQMTAEKPWEYASDAKVLVRRPAPWLNSDKMLEKFPNMAALYDIPDIGPWRPLVCKRRTDYRLRCHACDSTGTLNGEGQVCDHCGGDLPDVCDFCNRAGFIGLDCPECAGKGYTATDRLVHVKGTDLKFDSYYFDTICQELGPCHFRLRQMLPDLHAATLKKAIYIRFRGDLGEGLLMPDAVNWL